MSDAAEAPGLLEARFASALDRIRDAARSREIATGWLRAESSDFVRFNRGRIRQAGSVEKASVVVRLLRDGRQASLTLTLAGEPRTDAARLDAAFERLRELLAQSDPDPWLASSKDPKTPTPLT